MKAYNIQQFLVLLIKNIRRQEMILPSKSTSTNKDHTMLYSHHLKLHTHSNLTARQSVIIIGILNTTQASHRRLFVYNISILKLYITPSG